MKWREEWSDDEVPLVEKIVRQKPRREEETNRRYDKKHRIPKLVWEDVFSEEGD